MRSRRHLTDSELVVDVVRSFAAHERWRRALAPETVDAVLQRAASAALLPVVLHQLRASDTPVPGWTTTAMTQRTMWKLAQRADLLRVADWLDQADVRWLLFKGPVLDDDIYRVPGLRTYGDVDVLIHPDDFERGWRALQRAGARDLDLNWERLAMTGQSEITLRLPAGSILDLHWHVISNRRTRASFGLDSRALFERTRSVTLWGRTLRTFDDASTLQYLCLHAALAGAHGLRWMLDIHEAARRAPGMGSAFPQLDLVTAVMVDRAYDSLSVPSAWASRPHSVWRSMCRRANRFVPVSAGGSMGYSGQALFRSTRSSTAASVTALTRSVRDTWRRGPARRSEIQDQAVLRRADGTPEDLARWLATVRDTIPRPGLDRRRYRR